ncbi:hypothetical protein Glove_277g1 [Diversispora epigaea]|uniref:Uncharacterized protein n=1 Tax=Diversispora epigaea TaxID=1348612 RepID=A0A397I2R8_9GLOM|nr:hypothetical protein Glove_277g1 [Diversispora epigaea]
MNILQLSYSKHCILVHNNREYFINYCPIKNCIEILLSNSEILQHFIFKYENKKHQGEKSYAEQNSGNWWKYAEASIPSLACILSLILYSDATTTDTLGKSSLHPIYIFLGNISTWRRNKEDAKQLLGYFPILFAKNEKEKISSEFKKLVRETFHKSLKFLLDSLFENENGIDYRIICSNFPCHFCLVQKNDLIDTMQDQIILRNHENMMEHFNNNTGHSRIGAIPRYPGLKIFSKGLQSIARLTASEHRDLMKVMVFVVDGLLSNDLSEVYVKWNEIYILSKLEIFKESDLEKFQNDLIDTMQDQIILRNHENMMEHFNNNTGHSVSLEPVENYFWNIPNTGRSSIDKMNKRIGAIPRYPGLKIFSKGLQSIARLTASEHRDLMKVMVFVVDGLLSNDLSEVYVKWNEIYILSKLEIFKESDLEKFQKAINDWADLAINEYTTETYESLHKSYVKTPYHLSNRKDIEEQIIKTIQPSIFFEQQKKNLDLTENIIKGFAKFLECLDSFFDMLDIISAEDCRIKIFAIAMDDAELFEYQSNNGTLILPNKSLFHLALVQWYDFKSKKTPFVYDCPLLKLVEIYNFIEIEAIEEIVHIVPRFDTKDEYFIIAKSSRKIKGYVN